MKCEHFKIIEYFDSYNEKVVEYLCVQEQKPCTEIDDCYPKQIERLKIDNKQLKDELNQYKKYRMLFEKAKEMKEQTDKWAKECLSENEDLKDSLKRTICQAECFKHKEAARYKNVLLEIKELIKNYFGSSKEYKLEQGDWVICEDKSQKIKDGIVHQIENKIKDNL